MTSNSALAALILPWAKEHHPEKYDATLGVAAKPRTFRGYMLRLVEIRCEQDPAWRMDVPLNVLEETALVVKLRTKGDDPQTIEVKGKQAPGSREWSFAELGAILEAGTTRDFHTLIRAKRALDLELIEP